MAKESESRFFRNLNRSTSRHYAPFADWRGVVVVEYLDGDPAAGDEDAVGDGDLEAVRRDQLAVQGTAHVQLAVLLHLGGLI